MTIPINISCILLLISFPVFATVTLESCLDINRFVGISMTDAMIKDFGLNENDIKISLSQPLLTEESDTNVKNIARQITANQLRSPVSYRFYRYPSFAFQLLVMSRETAIGAIN